jgi:hypothetical protein
VPSRERATIIIDRHRGEMILDIRIFYPGPAADEATAFKLVACLDALAQKEPLRANQGFADQIGLCAREMSALTWVARSSGSPITIFSVRALSLARSSSRTALWTNTRVPLVHSSPAE